MNTMIKRNTMLYFRDRSNLFFSMLSIMIIVALFALFLGQGNWGSDEIRDTWLMAGILGVAAITTSIGAVDVVISDRLNKRAKGFYASPIKRSHITASYIASPLIAGILMTTLTAIGFGAYIVIAGGEMPDTVGLIKLFGLILLSNFTGTAILCFIAMLIKSISAWNTIGTIIGTLSGFLMGVYMPVGNLPNAVQIPMVLFPPFHSAMLFRQILMEKPLEAAYHASSGAINTTEISDLLGATYRFNNFEVTPIMSVLFLVVAGFVFFALSAWRMRKIKE